jgi:hypothetical protein
MTTRFHLFAVLLLLTSRFVTAQHAELHINDRWKECSFQLDPSLTQQEWHEFTREAGMVVCFRPLTSAKSLGAGRFEVSLLQWKTGIDETKGAWNNTFVHPHAEHYLIGGDALPFPGLALRAGLTEKLDAGIYWSMRPGANYGFLGGQLQYNFLNAAKHGVDLSSRLGFNTIYGPKDLNFAIYSLDLLASRKFNLYRDRISVSPYAGCSGYLSHAHEKTALVALNDENVLGMQGTLGAVVGIGNFSIASELNMAKVNTVSLRFGYNFKLWTPKTN